MKKAKSLMAGAVAVTVSVLLNAPVAKADAEQAKGLFKAMSDYMAKQQNISVAYDTSLDVVTKEKQKLTISSSGQLNMSRPDQLRVSRRGGFANVELFFDGSKLTLVNKETNEYAQKDFAGNIDSLIEELRNNNRPLPGAALLVSGLYEKVMPMVTDVKDLGSGVIRGEECDHIALRTKKSDIQLWIGQGAIPHPCRLSIISVDVPGNPEYRVELSNWNTNGDMKLADYKFTPSKGAKLVDQSDLLDFDELPEIYRDQKTGGIE